MNEYEFIELHRLLEDTELAHTALLVVSNKIDLDPHASEQQLIRGKRHDITASVFVFV